MVSGGATVGLVLAAWMAAASSLAQSPDPVVEHVPLTCAVADRHAVVTARTEGAARMQVHFRAPGDGPWYVVDMRRDAGAWTARLPRATRASFEYRVARQEPTLAAVTTPAYTVPVVSEPGGCSEPSLASVESQILVSVPEGAPLVPPVPFGFSPVGVLAFVEETRPPRSKLVLAGIVAVPVGVATLAATSGRPESKSEDLGVEPAFKFNSIQPAGGPISLAGTRLTWLVDIDHAARVPVFYAWTLELLVGSSSCASTIGSFQVAGAQQRTLSGGLRGTCPVPFTSSAVRVGISLGTRLLYQAVIPASFAVGP
jgi:hypothetical protein